MAKKETESNPKIDETTGLVNVDYDEIEVATPSEDVGIEKILAALMDPNTGEVGDASEWQATITSAEYFWPAARGLVIRGKILGVEERTTSFVVEGKTLSARFYTFELTAPCIAIRSSEMVRGQPFPRPVQCQPEMHVSVLERTILRRLDSAVGKEVIVSCDGPGKTKRGLNLWKYRAWLRTHKQPQPETITTTAESVA